jgi:hypothetical protein
VVPAIDAWGRDSTAGTTVFSGFPRGLKNLLDG